MNPFGLRHGRPRFELGFVFCSVGGRFPVNLEGIVVPDTNNEKLLSVSVEGGLAKSGADFPASESDGT